MSLLLPTSSHSLNMSSRRRVKATEATFTSHPLVHSYVAGDRGRAGVGVTVTSPFNGVARSYCIRVTFLTVWGRTGRKSLFSAEMIPLVDKWLGRLLRGFALVLGKVGTAPVHRGVRVQFTRNFVLRSAKVNSSPSALDTVQCCCGQ